MPASDATLLLNGDLQPGDRIPAGGESYLVAVDGGLRHLRRLDRTPDLLLGDLDSVSVPDLAWAEARGVELARFPAEKDETDFELALLRALRQVPGRITVLGGLGGRLDHTLANLALLAHPDCRGREVVFESGPQAVRLVRDRAVISGRAGDLVSLVPWNGACRSVTTRGLKYPLEQEELLPERSRGISNVMLDDSAEVLCREGMLLCVHTRLSW